MATSSVSSRECAELLLTTIPHLTRIIAGCCRQHMPPGEDAVRIGQAQLLHMIACGSYSLRELAARHHVTPSTMSRSVDVLVQRGWITRQHDPHDRRQVVLSLTESGSAVLSAMGESMRVALARLVSQLEAEECRRHLDGLQALRAVLTRLEEVAHGDQAHDGQPRGVRLRHTPGVPGPTGNRGAR